MKIYKNYKYMGFELYFENGWWRCSILKPWHFTTLFVAKTFIKAEGYKFAK